MLEDLRKRAKEVREKMLKETPNESTRVIDNIITLLYREEGFNRLPQSTCFNIFVYLGYPVKISEYVEMYNQLMEDVNKKYIYVNPDDFKRGL